MSLGNRIRRERERMGMNQAELGARVDPQVTREAVTKWENDRAKPRPDTIAQLAALFGMTISELMGEDAGLRSGVRMPLYGWTHAGEPMEEIAGDDYAYVPPVVAERHPRGFLLRVRGGCMDRVIPDGSLVCVDPDALVCPLGAGNMARTWRRLWGEGRPLASLPYLPLSRMRATHETMMQAAGVPDSVNAAAHGHSVAVAYGHYMRPDSASAAGDVGDMLAGSRGQGEGVNRTKTGHRKR